MLCLTCKGFECLKTRKVCNKVNRYLKDLRIFASSYIRPKISSQDRTGRGEWREIPFSALPRDKDGELI